MKFEMPDTRLCKQIFDTLLQRNDDKPAKIWPYVDEIKKVFNNVAIDHALESRNPEWLGCFLKLSLEAYKLDFFQEIDLKKSLRWYQMFKRSSFGESYLFNVNNFAGARLKFLARTGCLGVGEDLERWGLSDGRCPLCKDSREDLAHFLFVCPALNDIRLQAYRNLEVNSLKENCKQAWQRFSASSLKNKVCWFLGEHAYDLGQDIGELFDQTCKTFLVEAWHYRRQSLTDFSQ